MRRSGLMKNQIERKDRIHMLNLKEYLDTIGIKPDDIANGTGLPLEMIGGIINGDVNIMDVNLGSILLLSQYLKLPLSDFAGYCAVQQDAWNISNEDRYYYLSFPIVNKDFRIQLAPISPTSTKYIKVIAATLYEHFLNGIIDAKQGQVSVYRKQVELEMRKLDASDCSIKLIDDEKLEDLLDAGRTPQEAAQFLAPAA